MKIKILLPILLLILAFKLNAQVPTTGLIGYWPFNGNANDESSNANNGLVIGATLSEDRFGNANSAYIFDGNDGISITDDNTLDMTGAVSFSVWIKPSQIQTSGNWMILGKSNYGSTTNYLIRQKPNGYIQWEYKGYLENTVDAMTAESWYHIVVTTEGPDLEKKIYLDNVLVATQTASGSSFGQVSNPLTIGYASYNSEYFKGVIDDIRMFDRVLSATEVDALFNEENGSVTTIENTFEDILTTYPNPTNGELAVDLGSSYSNISLVINDINGRIIDQSAFRNSRIINISLNESAGVYFITVIADYKKVTIRVIKK